MSAVANATMAAAAAVESFSFDDFLDYQKFMVDPVSTWTTEQVTLTATYRHTRAHTHGACVCTEHGHIAARVATAAITPPYPQPPCPPAPRPRPAPAPSNQLGVFRTSCASGLRAIPPRRPAAL